MTSIVEPLVRWIVRRYPLPLSLGGTECEFVQQKYTGVCGLPTYDAIARRGGVTFGSIEWSNQGHMWVFNAAPRMNISRGMIMEIYAMMRTLGGATATDDIRRTVSQATSRAFVDLLRGVK